ncbi:hypothetical protein V9R50_003206 [Vibrio cholerae]
MKCITLSFLLVLVSSGCSSVNHDPVDTARYQYDRTLSLEDIAPVLPAYVDLPYERCDRTLMKSKPSVVAEINSQRDQRVYLIEGRKCVLPKN